MDGLETTTAATVAAEQAGFNSGNYTINACFLPSVKTPEKFKIESVNSILSDIKNQRFKPLIDALPDSVKFNKAYKAAKLNLPAWALNGTFSGGTKNENFKESNGLFHIDVDSLTIEQVETVKQTLIADCPHLYAIWISPSGRGLKILLRIPDDLIHNDSDFKKAYAQIEPLFVGYGVTIDKSCKDVRRLCFVCSDPDIYINKDAQAYLFDMAIWNQSDKPKQSTPPPNHHNSGDKQNQLIERACDIIRNSTHGNHHSARCKAGFLAGGQIAAELVNEAAVIEALERASDAISARYGDDQATINNAHKAILDGIAKGKLSPVDDDRKQHKQESTNSGAGDNSQAFTHNAILDNEQHHCTVDFLKFVDDRHPLKQLALSIASATHLPVHTVFLMGLAVFSSVACRWWRVSYQHGGVLPIGLYVVAEQPSGAAKSRCLNTFQSPFYAAEKEVKNAAREKLKSFKSMDKSDLTSDDLKEIESLESVIKSVLFTTNSTPEALEQSLTHSRGYFSAVSSEQGLFNTMLGACYGDGKTSNNDLLLNGFDGGYMSSKRVGRETYSGAVVGSAVMFAQMGGIENLLKVSNGTGIGERFLLIAERHNLGNRDHTKTAIINHDLVEQYSAVCNAFAGDILSNPIEYDQLSSLKISTAGWLLIAEYRNSIERHLADGGRYSHVSIRGAAAKIDIQAMKLSAVLQLLDDPHKTTIDDRHVKTALAIANAMIEANLKLCQDKCIVGVTAAYKSILSLYEKSQSSRTERNIIQSKSPTAPFKDFTGNKSDLIRATLKDMVNDGVLQFKSTETDPVGKYSLAQ